MTTTATRLDAAVEQLHRGRYVVPVPPGKKGPKLPGWQGMRLSAEDAPHHFGNGENIGIILGEPSGVVDVDLDCPETLAVADRFLPLTGMIHGRPSKPRSHRWYAPSPIPSTKQYRDINGSMLVELRSTGGQTLIPPSAHPSGEPFTWDADGAPAAVEAGPLQEAVACVAAVALLARHWPAKGSRHDAAKALAGLVLRAGWTEDEALSLVEDVATTAGDEEWRDRLASVRSTAKTLAADRKATGGPTLAEVLTDGGRVLERVREWLSIRSSSEPAVVFEDHEDDSPERKVAGGFPEAAWRGIFGSYRTAMREATHAPEAALFAGLWAAAAACLGRRAKVYLGMNVYPNVALTVYGETGDGKTTATRHGIDRLHALDDAVGVLRGSGSGEGVVDWLKDTKAAHLWFAEEFSEILIRAGWDGSTIKSVITSLYDCPDSYELKFKRDMRKGEPPPRLIEPTLNLLVCTTPATFWKYLRDDDIESGFGNRWFYLTGQRRPTLPLPVRPDEQDITKIEQALARLTTIVPMECRLAPDTRELWSEFYRAWDAERWAPLTQIATKRIPHYVLKLAMVYAALEGTIPDLTSDQLSAAILVGHYAARCADRLMHDLKPGGWRGRLETRILDIVGQTPLPPYRLKRQLGGGVSVEDVDKAIRALARAGELVQVGRTKQGRPVFGRVGVSYGK